MVSDPIRDLEFAHIADDCRKLFLGDLGLGRHVYEVPMELANAQLGGEKEGAIGMMAGIIEVVYGSVPRTAIIGKPRSDRKSGC